MFGYNQPMYGAYNASISRPGEVAQGYFPPQNVAPAQPVGQTQGFLCRPVTSKAEAIAAQIPFDGSTSYFVDTSNGNIYAKTFSFQDGTAPIVTYVREAEHTVQYATIDDLNALREELRPRKAAKKDDE
jgi:hypothetical protein